MYIEQAPRRDKPLFVTEKDLSKAFASPERAIKHIALRRLGVPDSVVIFLASLDGENEVHIITIYGPHTILPGWKRGSEPSVGWSREPRRGPSYGWP